MKVRLAAVVRTLALLVGTSVFVAVAVSLGPRVRPLPEPWSHLPPTLAASVHVTIAELPIGAVERDSLRDIGRWPKTMTFEGVKYDLVTYRGSADIFGPVDPKVPNPGGYYQAFYSRPEDTHKRMGPAYVWLIDSTLVERSYRTDSWVRVVVYDAKGKLRGFRIRDPRPRSRFSCDRTLRRSSIEEWFGDRGQLVAFEAGGLKYWNGVERTQEDYSEIWQRWFQILPARGRLPSARLPSVWDGAAEELRPLMHATTAELPAFPARREALDDARRWPATWEVDGNVYRLFYVEYRDRKARDGLRRVEDIRPSSGYGAYYSPNGRRAGHLARGPFYTWSAEGVVWSRDYRTDTTVRHWINDSKGRLLEFQSRVLFASSWWSCARTAGIGTLVLDEWYSNAGELVGFQSQADGVTCWKGLRVPPAAYADSLRRWLSEREPIFRSALRM